MTYTETLICSTLFAYGLFVSLVAIGGALKVVQWIGKKLGVKAFGQY
jgi:hypothetical protein